MTLRIHTSFLLVFAAMGLSACAQDDLASSAFNSETYLPPERTSEEPTTPTMSLEAAPSQSSGPAPGTGMTAGMWDDNDNFEQFLTYLNQTNQIRNLPQVTRLQQTEARERFAQREPKNKIDIVLLVDTTGSMYDELDYLKAEFMKLDQTIRESFCRRTLQIRLGLIAYADEGEPYVVLNHGFAEPQEFEQLLNDLPRTHGGDYPEAAAKGLMAATQLPWVDTDNSTRMVFWMADAPHHVTKNKLMTNAVQNAIKDDIHIYPIAASGLDERTEKLMRITAQVTGGRYIFLTDDSGIGEAHKEPRIPCYFVTSLQDAIERAVLAEITGDYSWPSEEEIIRTGGNPEDGLCTLANGDQVIIF